MTDEKTFDKHSPYPPTESRYIDPHNYYNVPSKYRKKSEETAYHEAGHLVTVMLKRSKDMALSSEATIVPKTLIKHKLDINNQRENRLYTGWIIAASTNNYPHESSDNIFDDTVISYGGMAAELIVFGEHENFKSGRQNDLIDARKSAETITLQFGHSDFDDLAINVVSSDYVPKNTRDYSTQIWKKYKKQQFENSNFGNFEEHVEKIQNKAMNKAFQLISENRPLLDAYANALLEKGTIYEDEINAIYEDYKTGKLTAETAPHLA